MSSKTRAFTLVELLIAVGIFSVLGLGIYRISAVFGKGASRNIQVVDSLQEATRALYTLHEELFWCSDIDFPPLKIHSEKIEVNLPLGRTRYVFENGNLSRSQNGKTLVLLRELDSLHFYRHDTGFLEISLKTLNQSLTTWIYLENLY